MDAIREHGRATVNDLAEALAVTTATVRRDLSDLEERGLLRRTHGGAVRVERVSFTVPVTNRVGQFDEEKRAIAAHALGMIDDDMTVGIDAGTSTIELAKLITPDRRLTVVTYSLIVASTLAGHPDVRVQFLGGEVRENSRATVGSWTLEMARRITLDIAFLSVDGISPTFGLTTHNLQEAEIKRALMDAARRSVVLADRSKLARSEFGRIAPLEDVHDVVTDDLAPADLVADVTAAGPTVTLAEVGRPPA